MFEAAPIAEALRTYLVADAPVLALVLDAGHRVTAANPQALRLLPEGLVGRPFTELVVDFTRPPELADWLTGSAAAHRLTLGTAAGLPETLAFRFLPLPGGVLALGSLDFAEQQALRDEALALNRELNDLTRQLHLANAELRDLNALKNRFIGMAAHDLRRPLGVVLAYNEFLLEEAGDRLDDEQRGFLRTSLAAAAGMKGLIDNFLDVAVIESGALRLEPAPTDAATLLAGALPLVRLVAARKGVELITAGLEDRRPLVVDAAKVQQVLVNLLGNAIEHSRPGQRVWLAAARDGADLVFTVRDEGQGIAPEDQAKLFAPFARAGTRKTAGERSVGLGLAIARLAVEAHGGRIGVASVPGEGATFSFTLPLPAEQVQEKGGARMTTGIFGQQLTLMEELKAGTFAAHAGLQAAPYFEALAACRLPLESYVGQLRALALFHGVLEEGLAAGGDPRLAAVWSPDLGRLPRLALDLRYFEPRGVADLREAAESAQQTAEALRRLTLEQPLALLGCAYVLEGSLLGAVLLRPLTARAFLLEGEEGLASLGSDGPPVHVRWAQFSGRMNALQLDAAERAGLVAAARDFFARLDHLYRALHPFEADAKIFLVTSINPEAGRHPVPDDEREVRAALQAADACWQRFPYFGQRYGERGQRFARSDAAWLATLGRYEPDLVLQQVRWLGRVLAARGMPTLLLQVQLELLAAALTAAVPEKAAGYARLAGAAEALNEARRRHVSDARFKLIDAAFDQAAGPDWSARFPHTGALLACAAADEGEGSEAAVSSLRAWLADPARFPAEWIAALDAALAQARTPPGPAAGVSP